LEVVERLALRLSETMAQILYLAPLLQLAADMALGKPVRLLQ
jgi:hypothetical protein